MRLRVTVISALPLLLTACTMWGDRPARKFADATGGENLERVFWQEVKTKNWTEVSRHLASNLMVVMPSGTLTREQLLEHLKQIQLDEYSLGDFMVEWHGPTVIVSYTITTRGTSAGHPLPPDPMRRVSVWQKSGEHWMLLAHTIASPTPP